MNKIKILTVLCALVVSASVSAQNVNEMLINEVLVENGTSIVDGYGNRNGWIELLNSSYGTVDIGGCYLTNDVQNKKKYLIPSGDVNTKIPPRQVVVFYASGNGDQGTFYTNFKIEPGDTIYFVSNDGRTVIDEIQIPADLGVDESYGRVHIEGTIDDTRFERLVPSPNSQNGDLEAETKSQIMARTDPYGLIISLTSMSVVFISLIVLFLIFKLIGKLSVKYMHKGESDKTAKETPVKNHVHTAKGNVKTEVAAAIAMAMDKEFGAETEAAIALALHLHLTSYVHDQESFILTIKPHTSLWSDKQDMMLHKPVK